MPRQKVNVDGRIEGQGKIRKRGCSSSSSSSRVSNYRLKRQILVGKRGELSTSLLTGKMSSRSPHSHNEKSKKFLPVGSGGKAKQVRLSARKLAATLWGINDVPSPRVKEILEEKINEMDTKSRERIVKHLSDPSHSPLSERKDLHSLGSQGRRVLVSSQKLLTDDDVGGLDSVYSANIMEVSVQSHGPRPGGHIVGVKARLEGVSSRLITSKELLKALERIWCMKGKHSTSLSLVSALKAELGQAYTEVKKLIREQQFNRKEIDSFLKQFEEEKAIWKLREQDRIHNAVSCIVGDLEVEKKLRRQTERLNRRLGIELADTKASFSNAIKKLESEKRAREILEQVCDELARGIGEDRAHVEELKRQSAKVRVEVQKEREMLQLADLLREERVQMKLSEAKYQFEEKNAAVDKLRNELEAYLKTKMGKETGDDGSPNRDRIKELEKYLRYPILVASQNGEHEKDEEEVANGEKGDGEDSADSDLHSIELNMDNNSNNYEWNYTGGVEAQNDSKRNLVDDKTQERKSISDKTKQRSMSLERKTLHGIEWEFCSSSQEKSDGFDRERLLELAVQAWKKSCEHEMERESMIKDLRDHMAFGSGIESSQGFPSPTRIWGQPSPSL